MTTDQKLTIGTPSGRPKSYVRALDSNHSNWQQRSTTVDDAGWTLTERQSPTHLPSAYAPSFLEPPVQMMMKMRLEF